MLTAHGARKVPTAPADEPEVLGATWVDPLDVCPISAFVVPLVEQQRLSWPDAPVRFHLTHARNAEAGGFRPRATRAEAQ